MSSASWLVLSAPGVVFNRTPADITPDLAQVCGFKDVADLLTVAKHGRGENVYLVRFHYIPPTPRSGRATERE